ncbi:MAG: glycoside hydrolase family 65 protein [Christensenellaceae bacterium]|nr:glycoside hydrolase family 65 protein [Christensenellaceae bacterium]
MYINIDKFDISNLANEETLFHVANGYLGVRACFEDELSKDRSYSRGCYINGFYDESPISYGEKFHGYPDTKQSLINLPDVQSISLYIDGDNVNPFNCEMLAYSHQFNLEQGFVRRKYTLKDAKGREFTINTKRMASFVEKHLFILEYTVESHNFNGNIEIVSTVNGDVSNFFAKDDPRLASVAEKPLIEIDAYGAIDLLKLNAKAKNSQLKVYVGIVHEFTQGLEREGYSTATNALVKFKGSIEQNNPITITKLVLLADSYHNQNPADLIDEKIKEVRANGAAYYFYAQEEYLNQFWNVSRVIIKGDENVQNALDYNLYSLLASVGRDSKFSVSAKGLSGEGYEGHVFWDSETYVAPFFQFTQPQMAKTMLSYRYNILSYAKEQAKLLGHSKGALFPWRSIEGGECSTYYPAGSAQYHINGDVAYSFMQYFIATKDINFMNDMGAEVLLETARLWMDMGHYTDKGFCLDMVTGPDEYTCLVNNNFYTNAGAQYNLYAICHVMEILWNKGLGDHLKVSTAELDEFKKAADAMYLPYDDALGITCQDDSFLQKKKLDLNAIPKDKFPLLLHYHPLFLYRHQVCKQADVVLTYVMHKGIADEDVKAKSFKYYEDITTHDSSLSLCAYAIIAAQLGDTEKAERYFKETVDLDLNNTHKNTKDGIHTANMGGSYLTIAKGFAGISFEMDGINIAPNPIQAIKDYSFNFAYLGRTIKFNGTIEGFSIELIDGEDLSINVYGESITLSKDSIWEDTYK